MNVMNAMDLQHTKEKGIFINVELKLVLASNVQERQRNFAGSIPEAVFTMPKVTLKKDVHLIEQPRPYFMFRGAGSPRCR